MESCTLFVFYSLRVNGTEGLVRDGYILHENVKLLSIIREKRESTCFQRESAVNEENVSVFATLRE